MRLPLAKYGLKEITLSFLVCCLFGGILGYISLFLIIIPLLIFGGVLYFFRNPARTIPAGNDIILAPADGTISNITLRPGDYVKAETPVFSLIETARRWVEANIKETDLTHVRQGQKATIEVDTYPGVTWDAHVESLSSATGSEFALLPPQNATGNWVKVVQRVPVRLAIDMKPGQPPLRAGMSVTVEIDTGHVRGLFGLFGGAAERP